MRRQNPLKDLWKGWILGAYITIELGLAVYGKWFLFAITTLIGLAAIGWLAINATVDLMSHERINKLAAKGNQVWRYLRLGAWNSPL